MGDSDTFRNMVRDLVEPVGDKHLIASKITRRLRLFLAKLGLRYQNDIGVPSNIKKFVDNLSNKNIHKEFEDVQKQVKEYFETHKRP